MERCVTKPIDFRGLMSAINDVVSRPIHDMVTVLDDTSSAGRRETSLLQFGIDANVIEFLWGISQVTNFHAGDFMLSHAAKWFPQNRPPRLRPQPPIYLEFRRSARNS